MLDRKVLVIGSGGREYAFAWKFLKDARSTNPNWLLVDTIT